MSERTSLLEARPWFGVGQHVIVAARGVGRIVEVGDLRHGGHEGYRSYRVNYGPTKCHTCGRAAGDRVEWSMGMHISWTVGERKRQESARV